MPTPSAAPSGTFSPRPENRPMHDALAEVALIDAKACAAAGGVSVSWWLDGVRRTEREELAPGEVAFPLPVIRQTRFTRWRLADAKLFWQQRASAPSPNAARLMAQATKASTAAAKKRRATLAASAA